MGVPQSLAAVLALLALVLAVEGVTRGSTKQLFAGLLLAIVATLTFSFGDTLSTFNIQMVEQLPRWSDVPHPLPEPAPPPAPAQTEAAPPKIQTTTSNDTSANLEVFVINVHPTQSPNGTPRFLAVYPREKFMRLTNWKSPPYLSLNPMYDALIAHNWSVADSLAQLALANVPVFNSGDNYFYKMHLLWVRGIASMEMGKPNVAVNFFDEASLIIDNGNSGIDDVVRFQVDREIVNLYSGGKVSVFHLDLLPGLMASRNQNLQEIALLHYARALRAATDNDLRTSKSELDSAKMFTKDLAQLNEATTASRLATIFNSPFGATAEQQASATVGTIGQPVPLPQTAIHVIVAPRFYAVYSRQIFMPDVDWNSPSYAPLNALYDAMEAGQWQEADRLSVIANTEYASAQYRGKTLSLVGHILWLRAIAALELGDIAKANIFMDAARSAINASGPDEAEQKRLQVALEVFAALSGKSESYEGPALMHDLVREYPTPWHSIALLYYAEALRAQTADRTNRIYSTEPEIHTAKDVIAELELLGDQNAAARLRSVFAARFPNN